MNPKKLKAVAALAVLLSTSIALGGGYFYIDLQKNKIAAGQRHISELQNSQLSLKEDMDKIQERQKKVVTQNRQLRGEIAGFTRQKAAILEQVKSSVNNFETFRRGATDEIERLKTSVHSLEEEKKASEDTLNSVQTLSAAEKERLSTDVTRLNDKISQLNTTQEELVNNLNKKDRSSMVTETAKLHYNLGNFYFRNKDYKNAAAEYKKSIFYQPDAPDAHFNLAMVSDDYLNDRPTAIAHYKRYLELRRYAVDRKRIQRRILDLELRDKVMDEPEKIEKTVVYKKDRRLDGSNFNPIGDLPK